MNQQIDLIEKTVYFSRMAERVVDCAFWHIDMMTVFFQAMFQYSTNPITVVGLF